MSNDRTLAQLLLDAREGDRVAALAALDRMREQGNEKEADEAARFGVIQGGIARRSKACRQGGHTERMPRSRPWFAARTHSAWSRWRHCCGRATTARRWCGPPSATAFASARTQALRRYPLPTPKHSIGVLASPRLKAWEVLRHETKECLSAARATLHSPPTTPEGRL